jgi:hypothetical protein
MLFTLLMCSMLENYEFFETHAHYDLNYIYIFSQMYGIVYLVLMCIQIHYTRYSMQSNVVL